MAFVVESFATFRSWLLADASSEGSLASSAELFDAEIVRAQRGAADLAGFILEAEAPPDSAQRSLVEILTDAVVSQANTAAGLEVAAGMLADLGALLLQGEFYLAQTEYVLAQCLADITAGLLADPPVDTTDLQADLPLIQQDVQSAVNLVAALEAANLVRQGQIDALHAELDQAALAVTALDERAVSAYAASIQADPQNVFVQQQVAADAALNAATAAVAAADVVAAAAARDAAQTAFAAVMAAAAPLEEQVGAVEASIGALVDEAAAAFDQVALLTAVNTQSAASDAARLDARAAKDRVRLAVGDVAIAAAEAEEARLAAVAAQQSWLLAVAEANLAKVEAALASAEASAMAEFSQIVALEVVGHAIVEFVHAVEAVVLEALPAVVGDLLPPDLLGLVAELPDPIDPAAAGLTAAEELLAAVAALQRAVVNAQAVANAAPAADAAQAASAAMDAAAALVAAEAAAADLTAAIAVEQALLSEFLANPPLLDPGIALADAVAAREARITALQGLAEAAEGQLVRAQAAADAALASFRAFGVDPNGAPIAAAEAAAELNPTLVAAFNAADLQVQDLRAAVAQAQVQLRTAAAAAASMAGLDLALNAAEARAAADLALAVAALADAEVQLAGVIASSSELALIESAGGTIHFGAPAEGPEVAPEPVALVDPAAEVGLTPVQDPLPEVLLPVVVPQLDGPAPLVETPPVETHPVETPADVGVPVVVTDPEPVVLQLFGTDARDTIHTDGVVSTEVYGGLGYDVLEGSEREAASHLQVDGLSAGGVDGVVVDGNGISDQFYGMEEVVLNEGGQNSLGVSAAVGPVVLDFNGAEAGRGVVLSRADGAVAGLKVSGVDQYLLSGERGDRIKLGGKLDADGLLDGDRSDDNYQISWNGYELRINGRSTGDASVQGAEWIEFNYQDANNASGGIRREFYVKEFAEKALSLGLSLVKDQEFGGDGANELVLRRFGNEEERSSGFYLALTAESLRESAISTLDVTLDLGETFADVFVIDPQQIVLTDDLAVQRNVQLIQDGAGTRLRFTGAGLEGLGEGRGIAEQTVLAYVGLTLKSDLDGRGQDDPLNVPLQIAVDANVDNVVWEDQLSLRDLGGAYALETMDLALTVRDAQVALHVDGGFDLGTLRTIVKPGEGLTTNLVRAGDTILQTSTWRNDGEFSLTDLRLTAVNSGRRDVAAEVTAWFADVDGSELDQLGWSEVAGEGESVDVVASFQIVGDAGSVVDTSRIGYALSANGGYRWATTEMNAFQVKHLVTFQSDVNYDGAVTMKDLAALNAGAQAGGEAADVDMNYDGSIDMMDLSVLDAEWGKTLHVGDGMFMGSESTNGSAWMSMEELSQQGSRSWDSSSFVDQNAIQSGALSEQSGGAERGYEPVLALHVDGVLMTSASAEAEEAERVEAYAMAAMAL